MGARGSVTSQHPEAEEDDKAPECRLGLHKICAGNAVMTVYGIQYMRKRCSCSCHPKGVVRHVEWTQDT